MFTKCRKNSISNRNSVVPFNSHSKPAPNSRIPRWMRVSMYLLCIFIYIVTIFYLFMIATVENISSEYDREVLTLYQPEIAASVYYAFAVLYLYGLARAIFLLCQQATSKRRQKKKRKHILNSCWCWSKYMSLFGPEGVFGHLGMFYEVRLIFREVVEIPAATFQAWSMSYNLSNPTMTLLFACIIFLNCLLSPITLSSKSIVVRRYVTPLLDVLFDFTFGVGFSIVIIVMKVYSYYFSGNTSIGNDSLWVSAALLEGRQVFVSSLPDLITKAISILFCYLSLQSLSSFLRYGNNNGRLKHKNKILKASSKKLADFLSKYIVHKKYSSFLKTVAFLWGFATFIIACAGINREICPKECNLQVYPWFFSECKCVQYAINCKKMGKSSSAFHHGLNSLSKSLIALEISQCAVPTKNVSNIFAQFDQLFLVYIHSTDLKPWENVNIVLPPQLSLIRFINSGVSVLPRFLTTKLPSSVRFIGVSGSAIASLPPNIAEKWKYLTSLTISHSLLSEFPSHLMRVRSLTRVNFQYNQIRKLPNYLIDDINNGLTIKLYFDGNPLTYIPFSHSQNATKILASLTFAGSPVCSRLKLKKRGENNLEGNILANMPQHCPESCSATCIRGLNNLLCDTYCNSKECNWDFGNCDVLV